MEENKTMNENLINSFLEITSSSREEATFFLESHRWDLDAAVSTFLDNDTAAAAAHLPTGPNPSLPPSSIAAASPSQSESPDYSPSETSPSRSRSPSPPSRDAPYRLRSKGAASENQGAENPSGSRSTRSRQQAGNIRTFADLNRSPSGDADSDSDEAQEYYTGGEKR